MHLSFNLLAVVTAGIFLLIAIVWLFAPDHFLAAWNIKDYAETRLIGRRLSVLYAGVSIMFFAARHAEQSTIRTALIYGLVSTCLILAVLGCYELLKGRAGKGILAAVLIEVLLSILFMLII
ncbi:hypothetical protein GOC95_03320 [Methylophilus sp. YYY-1]|nr:hypothetical protein [Methylophilus sp. YYY-1]